MTIKKLKKYKALRTKRVRKERQQLVRDVDNILENRKWVDRK